MSEENEKLRFRTVYVFNLEWTYDSEPDPSWTAAFMPCIVDPEEVEETFERIRGRVNATVADRMIEARIEANEYLRQTLRINRVFLHDDLTGRYEFGSFLVLRISSHTIHL